MKMNEKFWKITEIVLGVIGAALLILILILRIMGKDISALTYAIVGVVVLFLIADEFARSIRRRREKEEAAREKAEHPDEQTPESALPKDAFEFEQEQENENP